MPTVEPLSYSALDYLKSFGVVAVAVSPSGRVYVCPDPKGAAAAWWTKSEHADQIAHVAWTNADVPGAASRLGLTVTPHDTVLKRVGERVQQDRRRDCKGRRRRSAETVQRGVQAAQARGKTKRQELHAVFGGVVEIA